MQTGDNHTTSLTYNSRLQATHFEVSGNVVSQNIDHNADGRVSFIHNLTDANFDRSYSFDHAGRLSQAKTGGAARSDYGQAPYWESFQYDVWSNTTNRHTFSWYQDEFSDEASYQNGKRDGWGYDLDGRNTAIDTRSYQYDASGRQVLMSGQQWLSDHYVPTSLSSDYDGIGQKVKEVGDAGTTYYLRSSVLGGAVLTEINSSGQKMTGYVYAGGELIAKQANNEVVWEHVTPANSGKYEIHSSTGYISRTEFDPVGADVGISAPTVPDTNGGDGEIGGHHSGGDLTSRYADLFNPAGGCVVDGRSASCGEAMIYVNFGTGNSTSMLANASTTMHDIAHSIGVMFASAGASKTVLNVSGMAGTPGHETIEWGWFKPEGYGWTFGPVPTAYSGTAEMTFDVVSLATSFQTQQSQNPVGLNLKQQQKYDKVVGKLVNENLGSELKVKCASLLALTGFSINQIIGAIHAQQAYSGPDSTNISMLNAGLLPPVDPTLPSRALSAATFEVNETVSQYFKNDSRVKAMTATFGGNPNVVFFRSSGITSTTILHEALHSITGLGDIDLAAKLGLGNLTHDAASAAISKALKDNGCT
jgi:hypothetical protein